VIGVSYPPRHCIHGSLLSGLATVTTPAMDGAARSIVASGNGETRGASDGQELVSIEEAIHQAGIGRTQWVLLLICGLTFCSDAAEVTFLSYVTEVLRCEWGLSADQESWITSAVFVGMIIGAPIWGYVADKCGRRKAFLMSSLVITSFGFGTACCQSFESLLAVRAIVGMGVSGLPVGFDILAEALPAEGRGAFLLYIEYFWTLGSIYVNVCAWGVLQSSGWQLFTVLAAVPTLIASIAGYFFLPESPRWLIDEGRNEEALAIVNRWAAANGRDTRIASLQKSPLHESDDRPGFFDLFTNATLRRSTLLMSVVWFAFGVAYYGVVMLLPRIFETGANPKSSGSCSSVDFNFRDLAISAAAEVAGVVVALFMIDRPGRTWTQVVFYALGAGAAFFLGFRSLSMNVLTVIASIGRLAEMGASCATWVHTPELFPTKVRAEAHALLNVASKVGATCAPFLISDRFSQRTSAAIMAAVSLTAALAAFLLPETAGKELGQLHEDGDAALCDTEDSGEEDEEEEDSTVLSEEAGDTSRA